MRQQHPWAPTRPPKRSSKSNSPKQSQLTPGSSPQWAHPAGPGILFVTALARADTMTPSQYQAELLATAGITTMVPNNGLTTYTTTSRDYVGMAADYLTSLRSADLADCRPGTGWDLRRIRRDWIAPIMAAGQPGRGVPGDDFGARRTTQGARRVRSRQLFAVHPRAARCVPDDSADNSG
jgi:hypothetical protein